MKFDSLYSAMDKYNKLYNQVAKTTAYLEAIQSSTSALRSAAAAVQQFSRVADRVTKIRNTSIFPIYDIPTFLEIIEKQRQYIETSFHLSKYAAQTISRAFEVSTPYVCSEFVEDLIMVSVEMSEPLEPRVESNNPKKRSVLDVFSIISTWISILVTIYCTILSSLPDDQLDRIAAQNEIIIAQQEEILELKEEDRELQNTLNTLGDAINLLTEEVEVLRDELEHIDDSSIHEDQSEIYDSQQHDSDTQK